MPKRETETQTSRKKKKAEPKKQIRFGNGGAFGRIMKTEPNLVDQDVLFTDAIYGRTIPKDMEGQLFHYTVTEYDSSSNSFNVQYWNKMIEEEGVVWDHQDGEHASMNGIDLTIQSGMKLYNRKISDVRTHKISLY